MIKTVKDFAEEGNIVLTKQKNVAKAYNDTIKSDGLFEVEYNGITIAEVKRGKYTYINVNGKYYPMEMFVVGNNFRLDLVAKTLKGLYIKNLTPVQRRLRNKQSKYNKSNIIKFA